MVNPVSRASQPFVSGETNDPIAALSQRERNTSETVNSTASAGTVEYNPERASLGKMVYQMSHAKHGQATLIRHPKTGDSKTVKFEVSLRSQSGQPNRFIKDMYVTNQDLNHLNLSTIGYGDIDFPDEMKSKGMSYLVHKALADAGALLGVNKIAIDDVVSDVLEATCIKMGMSYGLGSSFNVAPDTLRKACDDALKRKGWQVESAQSSRTTLVPQGLTTLSLKP